MLWRSEHPLTLLTTHTRRVYFALVGKTEIYNIHVKRSVIFVKPLELHSCIYTLIKIIYNQALSSINKLCWMLLYHAIRYVCLYKVLRDLYAMLQRTK